MRWAECHESDYVSRLIEYISSHGNNWGGPLAHVLGSNVYSNSERREMFNGIQTRRLIEKVGKLR